MTRSSRSTTVTASKASKVAENQRSPSPKKSNTTNGKPVARSSPRAQVKKGAPDQTGDGDHSEESSESEEEETAKGAQKRRSTRRSGSPQPKKMKADKGVSNGVDKPNGSVSSSDEEVDTKKTTSKRPEPKTKSPKKGNAPDKATPDNNKKKKSTKDKETDEDTEGSDDSSDPEISLPGLTRGSKQKALETMNAITAMEEDDNDEDYEESDIEEILDSEDEDNLRIQAGEDGDSEVDSDDEDDDGEVDSEDEEAMKIEQQEFNAHLGKQAEEKLKKMKEEFEKALKQKEEEVKRMKNELEFKDQQLEDMNELSTKNMELEARISSMLSGPEGYKAEVESIARKKKEEEDAKKSKLEEEERKKKEKAEKVKEPKKSKGEKKKLEADTKSESDSDIEEINEEEFSEGKVEKTKSPRKRRGRRKKEEEDEGEKIEALFVSDDEDEELKEKEKEKKPKKGKKKDETKEENDIEVIEVQSGDEGDDKNKGRHTIRKMMGDKKLTSETKAAAVEEKERMERVAKLKEKHQIESHVDNKTKQPVYTKMVLAFKKDQKTPLVEVNTKLLKKLKPHQVDAVEFLWDSVIETTERLRGGEPGSGCIVAHCMGLGKTLSVITFVHTLLTTRCLKMKTCLVVCPLNTVLNWEHEWTKWLDKKDRLPTYEMTSAKDNHSRADLLQEWQQEGGIMIMGYQLFRILANSTTKSKKKKKIFDDSLISKGADIIVCDEGHVLKNDASAISKCMMRIRSKRRIILTGTPLQNNLIEYHCMVSFVKPALLGSRKEFCNRFVNPITNGQHTDSTSYDVKLMKRRAHVLHKMLSGCVQRRDYSALVKFLPPKYEYIISVRLSPLQMTLYEKYLEKFVGRTSDLMYRGTSLFSDYQALMRIWTHPWVLKMDEIRQEKKAQYTEDDDDELGSFLASDTSEEEEEEEMDTSSKSAEDEEEVEEKDESDIEIIEKPTRRSSRRGQNKENDKNGKDDDKKDGKKNKEKEDDKKDETNGSDVEITEEGVNVRRAKLVAGEVIKHWQSNSRRKGVEEEGPEKKVEAPWWAEYINEEEHKQKLELSGKLVILFDILRMAEGLGDKVLLFSQSLLSLDLIEDFLSYKNEEAEKLRDGKKGKAASGIPLWLKDEDYCRMDGSTSAQNRTKFTANFNSAKNKRMRLFLISTKAGGLGINLDSANRVVIFDASWNPSHDIQSIFRAYRFGQEKDVFIYRLLAQGTMEEKIYERQVQKESLSQRVIDEHQMDRHFSATDLQELYIFRPDRLDDPDRKERPTPKVPKDLILTELLSERKEWVVGYHEHDSLLEKRPDEDLDEEERKAAWEDYEKEKQGFYQYRGPPAPVNMFNYRPPVMTAYARPPIAALAQHAAALSMMRPMIPNGPGVGGSAIAAQHGFTTDQAKLNFQLSQLPRVVQEILKYNPNISPTELQSRLRAFMGMHTKYSDVPGFAMPGASSNGSQPTSNDNSTSNNDQNPASTLSTDAGPSSGASTSVSGASTSSGAWSRTAGVSPSQLSNMITESIVTATTGNMPSRLPQPGKVPGSGR